MSLVPMCLSPNGVLFICGWEKYAAKPYLDVGGRTTWGYGHLQKAGETPPSFISRPDALKLMLADAAPFVKIANAALKVQLNQNQFDALVSIIFNVGPGVPKVKDGIIFLKTGKPSTLLADINAGNLTGAAQQFLQWDRVGYKIVTGLLNRRLAESKLFQRPIPPQLAAPTK